MIGTMLGIIGFSTGGYYYSKFIEPKRLDINEVTLAHHQIPMGFDGFRAVQFSDTHLGFHYTLSQLAKHVDIINGLDPDIIFFTGDLLDDPNKYEHVNKIAPILKKLHAPFGKLAIYGNHDHGGYGTNIYQITMEEAGFQVLQNEAVQVKLINGDFIHIIGIDDAMLGAPDLEQAKRGILDEAYTILLSHAPDLATDAAAANIACQLSGHSHGGQVQLPFVGPVITPPFAKQYYDGKYDVDGTVSLYVNRGLGTTRLPFRFNAVPEITVFTLQSLASN